LITQGGGVQISNLFGLNVSLLSCPEFPFSPRPLYSFQFEQFEMFSINIQSEFENKSDYCVNISHVHITRFA